VKTSRFAGWIALCAVIAPADAQATAEQRRLVDQLAGPQREEAHRQLVAMGRKTVSALIDGLDDPRPAVVSQVLGILGELGPDAKPAVPVLLAKVSRSQPQREAVGLMGRGHLEERSDVVHRLAAEAILAIAAPDDPLVAKARAVLARLPAKSGDGK
jgi:hypothetical protein